MFNKIINKVFFTKRVFKILVVLTFFVSVGVFGWLCSEYRNPYTHYYTYDNIVEFVDEQMVYDVIGNFTFNRDEFIYENAIITQAQNKGIVDVSQADIYVRKHVLVGLVYSCEPDKLATFKQKYRESNHSEYSTPYGVDMDAVSIDCEKAQTVSLEPEKYYFIRNELGGLLFVSFVVLPITLLVVWLAFRFLLVAPVLWAVRKD